MSNYRSGWCGRLVRITTWAVLLVVLATGCTPPVGPAAATPDHLLSVTPTPLALETPVHSPSATETPVAIAASQPTAAAPSLAAPTGTATPVVASSIPMRGVVVWPWQEEYLGLADQLRAMNVNWVQIVLWPQITQDGQLIEYWDSTNSPDRPTLEQILADSLRTEEIVSSRIEMWHALGFKVFLMVYHERFEDHHEYARGFRGEVDQLLLEAKELAVRWAAIAERNQVEMYAPRKEFQFWVGARRSQEWDRDILPDVRRVYSGDLVLGVTSHYEWDSHGKSVYKQETPLIDVAGYDYLGLDFYGSRTNTFEELEAYYTRVLLGAEELRQRYGLKGLVFEELGIPHLGEEAYWNDPSLTGDELLTRFYDLFYRHGVGRIDGFFPWMWYEGMHDLPADRREYIAPAKAISPYYVARVDPTTDIEALAAPLQTMPPLDFTVSRTLIQEDFETAELWDVDPRWVHDGVLEVSGNRFVAPKMASAAYWRDYVLHCRFQVLDGFFAFTVRTTDDGEYRAIIRPIADLVLQRAHKVAGEDIAVNLREALPLVELGKWHQFTIYVKDGALRVFIDDELIAEYWDEHPLEMGGFAFSTNGHVVFDDVLVQELR